jgi:putative transposase
VRKKYQSNDGKSNHKFEVVGEQEVLVRVPLPMAEVWAEMQAQVERLTGEAGLQILRAILEDEVTRRVGPPHRPGPTAGCVRWGKQPGYVVFAGQKVPLERPRVRTREGEEVALDSYGQLQQDGKLQRTVRERMVAGLTTRNYRRAVESVLDGYGIEKSSVSRQFVAASAEQLQALCERRLEKLSLVAILIDGIHFGGQVQVVALGVDEGGIKHILGLWQGATENTTVVKELLEDLVDRGLDTKRRYLLVLDGAKALRAGVDRVFGKQAEVQRCQIHKRRNVKDHLPESCQADYDRRIRNAYAMTNYVDAKEALRKILRQLERDQSECRTEPGGGTRGNIDHTPARCRSDVTAKPVDDKSDRVLPIDRSEGSAKREAVARRRSVSSLDGDGITGSREEIQSPQRLSGNRSAESPTESVTNSTGGGQQRTSRLIFSEGVIRVRHQESRYDQLRLGHLHSKLDQVVVHRKNAWILTSFC